MPDRIFVGISFQNKGEDKFDTSGFPFASEPTTWKILPAKPKNQRQPMAICYHDYQLSCRPKAFHFVPNPDAIDFSRFPKCLMFQFGYTCSGLEGYAPWNDFFGGSVLSLLSPFSALLGAMQCDGFQSADSPRNLGMMQIQIDPKMDYPAVSKERWIPQCQKSQGLPSGNLT